jgi:hypothetical protein
MKAHHDFFAGQRNIWMLWLQGLDAAPELVKVCRQSWLDRNPSWTLNCLSRDTIEEYLQEDFRREVFALHLPPQKLANLIRLHLISHHGGVWVDADCYCARPLDDWLPSLMEGGFFAFRFAADAWLQDTRDRPFARLFNRSQDRILSNWFLAGRAGNPVSGPFLEKHLALLKSGEFGTRRRRRGIMRLASALCRRNAYLSSKLSNQRLLRAAGMFPYFIFHYHFARLVLGDAAFAAAWQAVSKLSNHGSIGYSTTLHHQADQQFIDDFEGRGTAPVYKLHWHLDDGHGIPGSRYRWLVSQTA